MRMVVVVTLLFAMTTVGCGASGSKSEPSGSTATQPCFEHYVEARPDSPTTVQGTRPIKCPLTPVVGEPTPNSTPTPSASVTQPPAKTKKITEVECVPNPSYTTDPAHFNPKVGPLICSVNGTTSTSTKP